MESGLAGVTAGNGAIYVTRRDSYIELDSARSHDGSFPFMLAKRGLRSLDVPSAVASEPMAPTIGGEFARKRRIMRPLWDVVVLDGMLSPRGYSPLYAFEIFSPPPAALPGAAAAPGRARGQRRPARRGHVLRRRRFGRPARRCSPRPRWPPWCRWPLPDRPLLRLASRPRSSPGSGTGFARGRGRPAGRPRAHDEARLRGRRRLGRPGARLAVPARRGDRDPARQPRLGDLPPAAGRQGRRAVRDAEAAHDGPGLRPGRGRHRGHRRRPAGDQGRAHAAPLRPRRAAQPRQRPARRDVDRRPAPDDRRPGRALHAAPARRLEVKPGITGWAQVQGRAGIPWEERIELDVEYVEHRSAGLDARILARTPRVLLAGSGATATGGADSELPASWKREKTEDRVVALCPPSTTSPCAHSSPATPPRCASGSRTPTRPAT